MPKDPRTAFISYTRKGGAAPAERLRQLLIDNGITPWQDRTHLRGGDDFRSRIGEAIADCSYFAMVLTPDSFGEDRQFLRDEWYMARRDGTCVVPIKGSADLDLEGESVPRWLKTRHIVDLDQPVEVTRLIEQLKSDCVVERVPFMAAPLPPNYTVRAEPAEALLTSLLGNGQSCVALTTAVRGPGGFGKTTLAQAICYDDRVIASFEHGILWVTLGEQPPMSEKLSSLITALTGEEHKFVDPDAARAELVEKLRWKRCLIVVDDVWDVAHLRPLLYGAPESVRLITTRQTSVAALADAVEVRVNQMTTAEAVALLSVSLPNTNIDRASLSDVAQRLGEWPVLLNLFAGHVRESIANQQRPTDAIRDLLAELNEIGPTAFDRDSTDRAQAIDATLIVSLRRLSPIEKRRCTELAIFPEDIAVPLAAVSDLWHASGMETNRTLKRLADLGLIGLDLDARSIALHDVVRDYLARHLDRSEAEVHASLVDAWSDPTRLPHDYAWRWFTYHLSKARRISDLRRWLTDPAWFQTRIEKHGLGALVDDFDYLDERDVLRLVQAALEMDAHVILPNPRQLSTQLLGRLGRGIAQEIDQLIEATSRAMTGPWLRPLGSVSRASGGALVRVIRGYAGGHAGSVRSIALDPHGRWAISAGNSTQDQKVIIWNLRSGSHRALPGQASAGGHTPLGIASDGTRALIASGSEIRLLETAEGRAIATQSNGDAPITAAALSGDGATAIWGAGDGQVYIWPLGDGEPPQHVGDHGKPIQAVDISRELGIAASATNDDITLWSIAKQLPIASVGGTGFVYNTFAGCFRLTDDGHVKWSGPRLVEFHENGWTASGGAALKQWGAKERGITVVQHESVSAYLGVSADGRRALVEPMTDGPQQVSLLDLRHVPTLVTLPTFGHYVSASVISSRGRFAATGDFEHNLFVWDLDRASVPLPQPVPVAWHAKTLIGFSTDGRFAVFRDFDGVDTTVDVETGLATSDAALEIAPLKTEAPPVIEQGSDETDSVVVRRKSAAKKVRGTDAGRVVKSGSNDFPVDELDESRGHTATVFKRRVSPSGSLEATVSHDGSARVWNIVTNTHVASYTSDESLRDCYWSPDGRTLAVIDHNKATHLLRLEGI